MKSVTISVPNSIFAKKLYSTSKISQYITWLIRCELKREALAQKLKLDLIDSGGDRQDKEEKRAALQAKLSKAGDYNSQYLTICSEAQADISDIWEETVATCGMKSADTYIAGLLALSDLMSGPYILTREFVMVGSNNHILPYGRHILILKICTDNTELRRVLYSRHYQLPAFDTYKGV